MKTKLAALLLMAGGAVLAEPRVAIGIQIGGPAPVVVNGYRPPYPGPGYVWVEGYYDPYGDWIDGYWSLPPYTGAYWVAPRYTSGRYFTGYWNGPRGIIHRHERFAPPVRHDPPRRDIDMRGRGNDHRNDNGFTRGNERGNENGFNRGNDRGNDRGHENGFNRGNDRGNDRGRTNDRGPGRESDLNRGFRR
jgi:hypothetical protein